MNNISIVEEQRKLMDDFQRRYHGQPKREIAQLLLLALEREEIVAVAFRESLMQQRLRLMPVPDEVRELIRHALIWIWKDEEMHSIYVRGAILQLTDRWLCLQALLRQTGGALGGWSSSISQHLRWRDAPLARFFAGSIVAAGRFAGQIPREVLPHLRHGPFRQFCYFNAEVEQAASETWWRIAELTAQNEMASATTVQDLQRITEDEDNHRQIFAVLADELSDDDHFNGNLQRLRQQIGDVGAYFLPRRFRPGGLANNPIGTGGPVHVTQGRTAEEKLGLFDKMLRESELLSRVKVQARQSGKSLADMSVVIKASFMMGYNRNDPSPVVDPTLVSALAMYLRGVGCRNIAVAETCNLYDVHFQNRTIPAVGKYFHYDEGNYELLDLSKDRIPHRYARGYAQSEVSRAWKEADFRISFNKLTSDPVEMVNLSLKNLLGIGGRCTEYLFRERQADYSTSIVMLCDDFSPHFALLDGYDHAPDGMVGMMACPRPPALRRFYCGADALAVDITATRHLGVPVEACPLLQTVVHWFGDPTERIQIRGTDERIRGWRTPYYNSWGALGCLVAFPLFENWSGRGSLFSPEMDSNAFPPVKPVGPLTRGGRALMRWVCGIRMSRRGAPRPKAE